MTRRRWKAHHVTYDSNFGGYCDYWMLDPDMAHPASKETMPDGELLVPAHEAERYRTALETIARDRKEGGIENTVYDDPEEGRSIGLDRAEKMQAVAQEALDG